MAFHIAAIFSVMGCSLVTAESTEAPAPTTVEVALPGSVSGRPISPAVARGWAEWLTINGFAFDRCGFAPAEGTLVVELSDQAQLDQLTRQGFTVVRTLRQGAADRAVLTDPQYFDPDEIDAMLDQAVADHPLIARKFTIGSTFEDRPIYAIEISNQPAAPEDEPAIQFNGQHHAREVATSHIVMNVIETLTDGYGFDPDVTAWVDNYTTVCIPLVNPDGVQHVFDVDVLWRKNRRDYGGVCVGVDLNRNYPYRWGPDACGFTSGCSGDTYKGPSAASELETQALIALAAEYRFVMATSYHSYGRFIDYPYACSNGSAAGIMPEHLVIHEMMNGAADAIDAVDGVPRYAVFSPASAGPLSGDDTSWYYAHLGTYSFIIEVGTSFEPPFGEVAGIVDRNRGGWEYLYQRLGQARIDVHVTHACSGEPLEAEVTLTDFSFDTGELPRRTFLPFGRWTFVVAPNQSYTLRVSEPGYQTQDVPVNVGNAPTPVNVALLPAEGCDGVPVPAPNEPGLILSSLFTLAAGIAVLKRVA